VAGEHESVRMTRDNLKLNFEYEHEHE
jgi:hypothetical protein